MAYWNLPTEALYEEIAFRREARIVAGGPVVAHTGKHTGRAANDKSVVKEASTEGHIWWGQYNRPYSPEKFNDLYNRLQGYFQGRDVFVQDCLRRRRSRTTAFPVRIITEQAWHSLFVRNMFILPQSLEEYRRHVPEFTVIAAPGFQGYPADRRHEHEHVHHPQLRAEALPHRQHRVRRRDQEVGLHHPELPPARSTASSRCTARRTSARRATSALFFGLSGTGKTTLSADPKRRLIGDDEHGWSDDGVFNFEGGCYAKVIRLSRAGRARDLRDDPPLRDDPRERRLRSGDAR